MFIFSNSAGSALDVEFDNGSADDGETDFVVIDPSRGILALEVKGGTSEVGPGGRWSTRGANGAFVPIMETTGEGLCHFQGRTNLFNTK